MFYIQLIVKQLCEIRNDKSLIDTAKLNEDNSIKHFHRADEKYSLFCRTHKIVILEQIENK